MGCFDLRLSEIIRYYSKKGLAEELIRLAKDREVVANYHRTGFGRRPDVVQFPGDIINMVRKGATSFHSSEELWMDPMQLNPNISKKEMDDLRIGFDLIFDIDCKHLDWSKLTAQLLIKALKHHDLNCFSIKFSGGSGFHIGIPYEALKFKQELTFPEIPRIVAEYLKEFIRPQLIEGIIELEKDLRKISEKSGKKVSEIMKEDKLNPYSLLEIDTILISPRHLFRMPYSLHEKTWLASIPLKSSEVKKFELNWAEPNKIINIYDFFLNPKKIEKGEASQLIIQALDWKNRQLQKEEKPKEIVEYTGKVPKDAFPPCIKIILKGLNDGRKRSLFILLNFLRGVSWDWQEIEAEIKSWNTKNNPPLKAGYVNSQLKWHARQRGRVPPPNCSSETYKDIDICKPDSTCKRLKNPLSYPKRRGKK